MLTELHTFANRPENVREVFLISFHDHRPNMETNPNGNCNPTIGRAVRQTLCQNLTKCPAVYQSSGSSAQWLSLAEMLRQGQRYVIVSDGRTGFSYLKSYEVSYQQESNLKQARKFVIRNIYGYLRWPRKGVKCYFSGFLQKKDGKCYTFLKDVYQWSICW